MEKKRVLLVDDDADMLLQTRLILEKMNFEVVSASSQSEAEKFIESMVKPDLAIIDLMMENKDSGFIISYKLKQLYPDLPIIILTALTSETGMMFSLEETNDKKWIKADAYLEKGIRPDQLKREITKLLKL